MKIVTTRATIELTIEVEVNGNYNSSDAIDSVMEKSKRDAMQKVRRVCEEAEFLLVNAPVPNAVRVVFDRT